MDGWVLGEHGAQMTDNCKNDHIPMLYGQKQQALSPQSAYRTTAADVCLNPS